MKRAYYFGLLDNGGHFLHDGQRSTLEPEEYDLPWTIRHLDSGLLKNAKERDQPTGRVLSTYGERDGIPWWAFVWWDRSGDRRGASNSGFYVRGFKFAEQREAFKFACTAWPQVVARQHHPLRLVDEQGDSK